MRKSGYTSSSETLDITMIISDTPTSPDPSESGAGPSGLGNISETEQNSDVDPENVIYLCDEIKCELIDPKTVKKRRNI